MFYSSIFFLIKKQKQKKSTPRNSNFNKQSLLKPQFCFSQESAPLASPLSLTQKLFSQTSGSHPHRHFVTPPTLGRLNLKFGLGLLKVWVWSVVLFKTSNTLARSVFIPLLNKLAFFNRFHFF